MQFRSTPLHCQYNCSVFERYCKTARTLWRTSTLPGRVTEEFHWIAKITSRRSAENDALLRVQVKSGTQLRQSHHYRYEPHGARTTLSPRPARWTSTNGVHLFSCASLLSLNGWSKTRIIRAVPYAGTVRLRAGHKSGVSVNPRQLQEVRSSDSEWMVKYKEKAVQSQTETERERERKGGRGGNHCNLIWGGVLNITRQPAPQTQTAKMPRQRMRGEKNWHRNFQLLSDTKEREKMTLDWNAV